MLWFDLVVVADPRQRGADGRCLAALLEAAAGAGYRTAIMPLMGSRAHGVEGIAAALGALVAAGRVAWLDSDAPVEAGLALAYHVRPWLQALPQRSRLRPADCLLRVDQPAISAGGAALFGVTQLADRVDVCLGRKPTIVAADPSCIMRRPAASAAGSGCRPWPPA